MEDVLKGPDTNVMRAIQAGIDAANREAVSNAQRIQKWMVLPRDFSLPGGEMGPTMKVTQSYDMPIYYIYDVSSRLNELQLRKCIKIQSKKFIIDEAKILHCLAQSKLPDCSIVNIHIVSQSDLYNLNLCM